MPPDAVERRLAAILAADVVGYSRLMEANEERTMAALKYHRREFFDPTVAKHGGRIFKVMGDGFLVEFGSAVSAALCAVDIQQGMALRNQDVPGDQRIAFRIGVNLGDVMVEGTDLHGEGVNVAARLEGMADPGGICVSAKVHGEVRGKVDAGFTDMGERAMKNIALPQRVYKMGGAAFAKPDAGQPERPSIAVLAFENMSGDPEQEYLSDGISEDIITELSRFRELFVIARNSSFSYKGKSTRVQDIGRDLRVGYVVEGSVRRAGRRVRITVQLVETETGNHVWAERYDREMADIFDLQDEITQTIASVLPLRLQGALVERARRKPTENLSAYECFLQAQWLADKTSRNAPKSLELLAAAIRIDPKYARAHALAALVRAYSVFTFSPIGADPTIAARADIAAALALGEGDHFVHVMACHVYLNSGEHDLAQVHLDKAIALNPSDFNARIEQGILMNYSGNAQAAVAYLHAALAQDPLAPDHQYECLAEANYMAGNYAEAARIYERWRDPPAHMYTHLAACHAQLGQAEETRHAAAMFGDLRPAESDFAFYARAHARICKRPEDAAHWLDGYRKAGLLT
ncbi:MAG: adenylate/guanylate cyclase domain-containing protein [Paracoccaceae bacterium]